MFLENLGHAHFTDKEAEAQRRASPVSHAVRGRHRTRTQDFLTSELCSYTELACGLWGDLSGPYAEAGVDQYAVGTPCESSKTETAVGELRVTS